MEKLTLRQLTEKTNWTKAVIVFTPQGFRPEFSEERQRSYEVLRDNKYFDPTMIGRSLYGNCLDGTDHGVRLDWYIHASEEPWIVDYCYVVE